MYNWGSADPKTLKISILTVNAAKTKTNPTTAYVSAWRASSVPLGSHPLDMNLIPEITKNITDIEIPTPIAMFKAKPRKSEIELKLEFASGP